LLVDITETIDGITNYLKGNRQLFLTISKLKY